MHSKTFFQYAVYFEIFYFNFVVNQYYPCPYKRLNSNQIFLIIIPTVYTESTTGFRKSIINKEKLDCRVDSCFYIDLCNDWFRRPTNFLENHTERSSNKSGRIYSRPCPGILFLSNSRLYDENKCLLSDV